MTEVRGQKTEDRRLKNEKQSQISKEKMNITSAITKDYEYAPPNANKPILKNAMKSSSKTILQLLIL
jgi:hypothetical protein